jgi:uncharacterized DUF497 family protein
VAGTQLQFEWDAANREHLARHGISATEFEQGMKNDPILEITTDAGGEWRAKVAAITERGRLLEMVYTMRRGRIRAITAFPMKKRRTELYHGKFEI